MTVNNDALGTSQQVVVAAADSVQVGKLERVLIRDVWPHEALSFTPWISQHLDLLGEVLHLNLELVATEHPVGPFRADLLCKSGMEEASVIIENQFGKTDHDHLGKLLTYAASTSAVTLVWIAERFTDEHRATLDWLNRTTALGINLFGLEIEAWRIGDSLPAPKFNVVSQPNDWAKLAVVKPGELSHIAALQLEFWRGFRDYVLEHSTSLKPAKPLATNWYEFFIGKSGFWIGARVNTQANLLRVAVFMDAETAFSAFQQLHVQRTEIEAEMAGELVWSQPEETSRASIARERPDSDLRQRGRWPEYFKWFLDNLHSLHQAFVPRIKSLSFDDMSSQDAP